MILFQICESTTGNWKPLNGVEVSDASSYNMVCSVTFRYQLRGSLIEHSLLTLSTSIDCKAEPINYIGGDEISLLRLLFKAVPLTPITRSHPVLLLA